MRNLKKKHFMDRQIAQGGWGLTEGKLKMHKNNRG